MQTKFCSHYILTPSLQVLITQPPWQTPGGHQLNGFCTPFHFKQSLGDHISAVHPLAQSAHPEVIHNMSLWFNVEYLFNKKKGLHKIHWVNPAHVTGITQLACILVDLWGQTSTLVYCTACKWNKMPKERTSVSDRPLTIFVKTRESKWML